MSFGQFLVVFLALALGERWYEWRFSQQAVRGVRKMEWSYTALHALYLLVFAAAGAEYFWRTPVIRWWVTAVGLILFFVALVVRLAAIRTLGRFWSLHLEIRAEHELRTEGIYSRVRHPAYAAIMVEMVAVPLVANAFGALLVAVGTYVPLLLWRWSREEREMVERFGERYEQYRKEVPAFFPWPHRK